jgi:prophage tail gpP-like protein
MGLAMDSFLFYRNLLSLNNSKNHMKDNIHKLMKLVSIVEDIADSEHFSQDQQTAQQNLQRIAAEGLQAIEECSTHSRRVEYERNLYYKLLNKVAPKELENLYHQVTTVDDALLDSNNSCSHEIDS